MSSKARWPVDPKPERLPSHVVVPLRRPAPAASKVAAYERAAIHESVPITTLVAALVCRGLTVSNVAGVGLVIHQIGQDPSRPGSSDAQL